MRAERRYADGYIELYLRFDPRPKLAYEPYKGVLSGIDGGLVPSFNKAFNDRRARRVLAGRARVQVRQRLPEHVAACIIMAIATDQQRGRGRGPG